MKQITTVVLAAAAAIAISTTASAHRPDEFDGGKTADFLNIIAKNKARLLEAHGVSSLGATAAQRSAATTSIAAKS